MQSDTERPNCGSIPIYPHAAIRGGENSRERRGKRQFPRPATGLTPSTGAGELSHFAIIESKQPPANFALIVLMRHTGVIFFFFHIRAIPGIPICLAEFWKSAI